MTKSFLLIITIILPGQQTDSPNFVFDDVKMCREVGATVVKDLIDEQRKLGQTQGSIWYRCQEVTGEAVRPLR